MAVGKVLLVPVGSCIVVIFGLVRAPPLRASVRLRWAAAVAVAAVQGIDGPGRASWGKLEEGACMEVLGAEERFEQAEGASLGVPGWGGLAGVAIWGRVRLVMFGRSVLLEAAAAAAVFVRQQQFARGFGVMWGCLVGL